MRIGHVISDVKNRLKVGQLRVTQTDDLTLPVAFNHNNYIQVIKTSLITA